MEWTTRNKGKRYRVTCSNRMHKIILRLYVCGIMKWTLQTKNKADVKQNVYETKILSSGRDARGILNMAER